jgi:hypothetical protein
MTVTTNYQFKWNTSFSFGADTVYLITNIDGLAGLPELRTQDDNRGYLDGMYSGRDFYGARHISFEITTLAGGGHTINENYTALKYALAPQQSGLPADLTPLEFKLPQYDSYTIWGRVRTNLTLIDPEYTYGYIKSAIGIYCPDPRYYGATNTDTGTTISVDNTTGNATTCPVITLTNPGTTFTIQATASTVTTTMSFDTTGISGTTIVINLLQRTITIDGLPARNILTGTSVWIDCPQYDTTVIDSSGPTLSVAWAVAHV